MGGVFGLVPSMDNCGRRCPDAESNCAMCADYTPRSQASCGGRLVGRLRSEKPGFFNPWVWASSSFVVLVLVRRFFVFVPLHLLHLFLFVMVVFGMFVIIVVVVAQATDESDQLPALFLGKGLLPGGHR